MFWGELRVIGEGGGAVRAVRAVFLWRVASLRGASRKPCKETICTVLFEVFSRIVLLLFDLYMYSSIAVANFWKAQIPVTVTLTCFQSTV